LDEEENVFILQWKLDYQSATSVKMNYPVQHIDEEFFMHGGRCSCSSGRQVGDEVISYE
jgi:hypothetical protein